MIIPLSAVVDEDPVKFESDWTTVNTNLAASIFRKSWYYDFLPFSDKEAMCLIQYKDKLPV